eukprot:scaffold150211_cov17-Tisochrysis_lutea.AAC.1
MHATGLVMCLKSACSRFFPTTQVSAGSRHSLALTEQGCPLAWGFNGFGQLGVGDTEDRFTPCPMSLSEAGEENTQGRVMEVAAGWWHSLLLVEP